MNFLFCREYPVSISNNTYISVSLVNDDQIRELNKKHREKDYSTDVLSFNINEEMEDGRFYLGDIIVNKEQAGRQAKDYENSVEEEISELVAHGVMHLLGVHHDGDDH